MIAPIRYLASIGQHLRDLCGLKQMDGAKALLKRRSVKYGIPFLVFIVAGSFGLKEFAQLRYTFSKTKSITREGIKSLGIDMKDSNETTLEVQYERIKTMDIDNWEQVRGPRPWEEQNTT